MIACTRCQREAVSVYRHITICAPCHALILAAGLAYCNRCQSATPACAMARPWYCHVCAAARQRRYYATNPAYRARQLDKAAIWLARHRETRRAYQRHYRAVHRYEPRPDRTAYRARANAQRRERYATDPAYREQRKAAARVSWPSRRYKLQVLRGVNR